MKKGNFILDENLTGTSHSLFNAYYGHDNQDFLLFISSLEDFSLQGINYKGLSYFKNSFPSSPGESCFFEQIFHPEDYPLFLHFLQSCRNSQSARDSDIALRVKSPFGYWKKYIFKSRIYSGKGEAREDFILTLARPLEQKPNVRKSSSANLDTEKSLHESLNRYRVLVNSLDQGFGIVEMIFDINQEPVDYMFVEVNPAFEKHTGLLDPLGKTMKEFFRDHESHWFEKFGDVSFTGRASRFEDYSAAHDTWFDVYAFPIGSKKSRKVAFLFSDVSKRKNAEEDLIKLNEELEYKVKKRTLELEENNDLLQMVFDTVNQGIFLLKPVFGENFDVVDFTYVRVNKKVSRYYKQGEMVGRSFLELNPQATKTGAFEIFKQTMLTGESRDFEVNFEKDGKNNWFKIITSRQKGLLVNSLENITRRKLRAQELKENIRFRKQLIHTSPDVIMIFNLYEEKIRYINRDISESIGMSKQDLEGMSLLDLIPLIHPQDRQEALEFHTRLTNASDKDVLELEFRFRGKERPWECFNARGKVFMRNKKGNPYEFIIMLRNVQEQKLTQQALVHAEKLSIKGEIARTLAHELRNPLASIGMSADILDRKLGKAEKKSLETYLGIIKRSTTTLNNLVSDLLNSANYTPPKMEKCCLARITNKALGHAKDRIYLTGVTVIKKYRAPYYINADEEKLKIALLNIIVNASEAMTPDEGILTLKISKHKDNFSLHIIDNGCGMEEEQLERLFESFYTQKPDGMGVGLSSVKNILDEHAATIKVTSKPKVGTTFILTFPCHPEEKGK